MSSVRSFSKILLLVDGSPASQAAARFLLPLAEACGAAVTAFAVALPESNRAELESALAETAAELGRGGLPVETAIVPGELVAEVVRKAAAGYELTAMALRRKDSGGRLSVARWKIASRVATPVLAIPAATAPGVHRILVASGGERYIERGLHATADFAKRLGAAVTLLHILPPMPDLYRGWEERDRSSAEFLKSQGRLSRQLRSQITLFERAGVPCKFLLRLGDVDENLFLAAREEQADLLVIGSSPARGAFPSYVLGNLTRQIISRSQWPVLILRSAPRGLLRDLWAILKEPAQTAP